MLGGGGVEVRWVIEEVFDVAIDDRERSAEFVRGIGDKVLTDLFGLVSGGDIAEDDTSARCLGWVEEEGRAIDPERLIGIGGRVIGVEVVFTDNEFFDRLLGEQALGDAIRELRFEEEFVDGAVECGTMVEELDGALVCVGDFLVGMDDQECRIERVKDVLVMRIVEVQL